MLVQQTLTLLVDTRHILSVTVPAIYYLIDNKLMLTTMETLIKIL